MQYHGLCQGFGLMHGSICLCGDISLFAGGSNCTHANPTAITVPVVSYHMLFQGIILALAPGARKKFWTPKTRESYGSFHKSRACNTDTKQEDPSLRKGHPIYGNFPLRASWAQPRGGLPSAAPLATALGHSLETLTALRLSAHFHSFYSIPARDLLR